jgi:hypothetical protein
MGMDADRRLDRGDPHPCLPSREKYPVFVIQQSIWFMTSRESSISGALFGHDNQAHECSFWHSSQRKHQNKRKRPKNWLSIYNDLSMVGFTMYSR